MKCYEFEVTMGEASRRFLLNADLSFVDLHDAIQDSCGWLDLEEFRFTGAPEKLRPFFDDHDTVEYRYGERAPQVRRTRTEERDEDFERRIVGGGGDMPSDSEDEDPDVFDLEALTKFFNRPFEFAKWSDDELLVALEDEFPLRAEIEEIVRRGDRLAPLLEEVLDDEDAWEEHSCAVIHATLAYAKIRPAGAFERILRIVQRAGREGWPEIADAAPAMLAAFDRAELETLSQSKTESKDLRKLAAKALQGGHPDWLDYYDPVEEDLEEFADEEGHVHGPECDHDDGEAPPPVRHEAAKVGRNDPCPCGSGKKHKKCCGR